MTHIKGLPNASRQHSREFFFRQHAQAARLTMKGLISTPLTTLLTVGVIGLALALPGAFSLILHNAHHITHDWKDSAQESLYLRMSTTQAQAEALVAEIESRDDVASARYISPAEGLAMFEKESGFADLVRQLPENPLPAVIEVQPSHRAANSPQGLAQFHEGMKQLPHVETAQMDMEWLMRLFAVMGLFSKITWLLMGLFIVAVLLIIGNTIRTATDSQRHDITVLQLIGATQAMIRRPFLYMGLFYGLLGGVVACLVVWGMCLSLAPSFDTVMKLYQSETHLQGLGIVQCLLLIGGSAAVGALGAFLAVKRYLASEFA